MNPIWLFLRVGDLLGGALIIRALQFVISIRAPASWKLSYPRPDHINGGVDIGLVKHVAKFLLSSCMTQTPPRTCTCHRFLPKSECSTFLVIQKDMDVVEGR